LCELNLLLLGVTIVVEPDRQRLVNIRHHATPPAPRKFGVWQARLSRGWRFENCAAGASAILGLLWALRSKHRPEGKPPPRGHLKVCALKHANSDKPRTQNSNSLIAFAELGFAKSWNTGAIAVQSTGESAAANLVGFAEKLGYSLSQEDGEKVFEWGRGGGLGAHRRRI
jgi:hypothetical protein